MKRSIFEWFHPRTAHAQRALEQFIVEYDSYSQELSCVVLTILIWGPGLKSSSLLAQKRNDIREALLNEGHVALFSEDIPNLSYGLSLRSQELAQAFAADLFIILPEDSLGALAEAEAFCVHPDLAAKAFILAPERFKEGFSGRGTFLLLEEGYGAVYWYTVAELGKSDVVDKAVKRARARREIHANYMIRARVRQ